LTSKSGKVSEATTKWVVSYRWNFRRFSNTNPQPRWFIS